MKEIKVHTLTSGMVFDKPLYLDENNLFLQAEEPLNLLDIERLRKWGIASVYTDGTVLGIQEMKGEFNNLENNLLDDDYKNQAELIENKLKKILQQYTYLENKYFIESLKLLEDYYNEIIIDRGFNRIQIVRQLAEDIIYDINNYPNYFFIFYNKLEKPNLYLHVLMVSIIAANIGTALHLPKSVLLELIIGILLMDVGMLKIPSQLQTKEVKFTPEEKLQLHSHPLHSYQLLTTNVRLKNSIAIISLQHNENFDGSGYPRKLRGEEINILSRIATISDCFISLLEKKSYRKSYTAHEAIKEMITVSVNRYDPNFLKAFVKVFSLYPIGSLVQLSDNSIGIVIQIIPEQSMRPHIILIRTQDGIALNQAKYIFLDKNHNLYISKILSPNESGIDIKNELNNLLRN